MAEHKRKERSILSFFPKRSNGETTESSTKLSEEGSSQSSDESDPQHPAAAAENNRDKPKTYEKESSQINCGFQESWLQLFPWLVYDKKDNIMRYSLCVKHRKIP